MQLFQRNSYGFGQRRLKREIQKEDYNKARWCCRIFKGNDECHQIMRDCEFESTNGRITKYVAIDCEMDQIDGQYDAILVCKVTIINSEGQIVLDTLVDYNKDSDLSEDDQKDGQFLNKIKVNSMFKIHKISQQMFSGAPSMKKVQTFIQRIATEYDCIFIGHAVENDLGALKLQNVRYIDTTNVRHKSDQGTKLKSLKHLSQEFLGWQIQDKFHSSIIDALATMALFLKLKYHQELFYSDRTIQNYNFNPDSVVVKIDKKRVQKQHRKHIEKSESLPEKLFAMIEIPNLTNVCIFIMTLYVINSLFGMISPQTDP